ncbi:MAG: methyl-accepting chemotaxis protein [Desulfatibacillum sp.]|nr:methyl-accepting chemotaxis protein [Desulfatibacillum sp.]
MPAKPTPSRRRQYFVSKGFQGAFIFKFCLVVFFGTVASTLLTLYFSCNSLTSDFSHSRLIIKCTSQAIMPSVLMTNFIILGLVTVAVIVLTLFASHKIAGPLFRLNKELEDIAEGDLTKVVKLRSKDQITVLAQSINSMAGQLHAKVSDIRDSVEQLSQILENEDKGGEWAGKLEDVKRKIDTHFKL